MTKRSVVIFFTHDPDYPTDSFVISTGYRVIYITLKAGDYRYMKPDIVSQRFALRLFATAIFAAIIMPLHLHACPIKDDATLPQLITVVDDLVVCEALLKISLPQRDSPVQSTRKDIGDKEE
jgi:hypothetical protein